MLLVFSFDAAVSPSSFVFQDLSVEITLATHLSGAVFHSGHGAPENRRIPEDLGYFRRERKLHKM